MHNNLEIKKRVKNLFFVIIILAILLITYFFIYTYFPEFTFKCAFFEITGFKCPGCGITRMLSNFIELKFEEGYIYNIFLAGTLPIILIGAIYLGYSYVYNKKAGKGFNILCFIYAVLLIIWGIVRNIMGL